MRSVLWIVIALLTITIAAYWQVGSCGFINLDDPGYVSEEPMVNQGLRRASVLWALTSSHGGNWHPLTSLSHILDCSLFGPVPGPAHLENLGWHLLNAMLVFLVWRSLTGRLWPSALVAVFFAIHPLHVESVAWIAERKDVLSTFFWLLGLGAYVRYARHPSRSCYIFVLIFQALGLMAKPMVVTFPCTLLLLDYWPLQRSPARNWRKLLMEKIPFFTLSGLFAVITYFVQRSAGAIEAGGHFLFSARTGNAVVSAVRYLGKTFWPNTLTVFYPHPGFWPWVAILGATLLLVIGSWLALRQRHSRPWLSFGWGWFLVTLLPVIGLIQVGGQAMADRYTYVPLLGIFTIVIWAGSELVERWKKTRFPIIVTLTLILGACVFLTQKQVAYWKSGATLFEHNLAVTEDNSGAHLYLADAWQTGGGPESEVVAQYRRALELQPDCIAALNQMARLSAKHQHYDEARALLEQSQRLHPENAGTAYAQGILSEWQGQTGEAVSCFKKALNLNPDFNAARRELAKLYFMQQRFDEAGDQLKSAIQSDRWDYLAHEELGIVLRSQGQMESSRRYFERAIWINPQSPEARRYLTP